MSITAGWLVLAVLIARIFLKKSPKWISCLLWGIVALRLVIPFSVESPLSMIPSAEVIPADIATTSAPAVHSGITVVNNALNPMMTQKVIESGNVWQSVFPVAAVIWFVGMMAILLYGAVSYLILLQRVRASICIRPRVYICDDVPSPFILGFFFPKIFLPSGLSPQTVDYVLLHELCHLRHHDHGEAFHLLLEHLCTDHIIRMSESGDSLAKEIARQAAVSRVRFPFDRIFSKEIKKYPLI